MLRGWPEASRMVRTLRDIETSAGVLPKGTPLLMLHESGPTSARERPDDPFTVWTHGEELLVRRADIE
jgi:hypothetical protein